MDAGEIEAIALALEGRAELLLIDERDGTEAARELGLTAIGTLGVLDAAAERGLVDLPLMFARLKETTFRMPSKLAVRMLEQDAARKSRLAY